LHGILLKNALISASAQMPGTTVKNGQFSEEGRAALGSERCREGTAANNRNGFQNNMNGQHWRQSSQRRQGSTEIVRRQAKFAGMRRQSIVVTRHMLDGVRPRHQLGEDEHDDEKEVAQVQHRFSLSARYYIQMARLFSPPEAASL
jgi:hypothetical protein